MLSAILPADPKARPRGTGQTRPTICMAGFRSLAGKTKGVLRKYFAVAQKCTAENLVARKTTRDRQEKFQAAWERLTMAEAGLRRLQYADFPSCSGHMSSLGPSRGSGGDDASELERSVATYLSHAHELSASLSSLSTVALGPPMSSMLMRRWAAWLYGAQSAGGYARGGGVGRIRRRPTWPPFSSAPSNDASGCILSNEVSGGGIVEGLGFGMGFAWGAVWPRCLPLGCSPSGCSSVGCSGPCGRCGRHGPRQAIAPPP